MSQITIQDSNSLANLMKTEAFNQGFKDVRNKRQFRYDLFLPETEAWAYELGRQFALSYIGPLKFGRRISVMAESALNELVRSGVIK
jgi:hypothetical protein